MRPRRRCSRAGCGEAAHATLTFAYVDSTAVIGPLALRAEPGSYDLCGTHSSRLSVPRGWEVVRLPLDGIREESQDDLLALAEAVREAAGLEGPPLPATPHGHALPASVVEVGRRGHLTLLAEATPLG